MTSKTLHGYTVFNSDFRSLRYLHNWCRQSATGLLPTLIDNQVNFFFVYNGSLLGNFSFPNCTQALKAIKEIDADMPF